MQLCCINSIVLYLCMKIYVKQGMMTSNNTIAYPLFIAFLLFCAESSGQIKTPLDTLKNIKLPSAQVIGIKTNNIRRVEINRQKLDQIQTQTLSASLSHISGVQNASFGPNSGSVMIRSLSGNRVKILSNGISMHDLSGMSPNLNVNLDMDNLSGIDIYKGSASVRYGGKAIGGAVDLKDNTVPQSLLSKKSSGRAIVEIGTNSGNRQALQIAGNLGKHWVWNIGGMNQSHKNLKIPANTKAPIAYDPTIDHLTETMAQVHVDRETIRNLSLYPYISQFVKNHMNDPDWGLSEADLYTFQQYSFIGGKQVPNPTNDQYIAGQDPATALYTQVVHGITDYVPVTRGIMPNSHAESRSVNIGSSFIKENYSVGIGYRALEGYYGVPGFAQAAKPKHSHDVVLPAPIYEPVNTRAWSHILSMESAIKPSISQITEIKFNYSMQFADDRELVGIYQVNKFNTRKHTTRSELLHQFSKDWTAISGLDFSFIRMDGVGEQKYLPNNLSRELGAFVLQKYEHNLFTVNFGYRHDWVARRVLSDNSYTPSRGMAGGKLTPRDFDLNQFSGDIRYHLLNTAYVQASYSHAERAPEVNELYAGNDHFAILVEENGDDRLSKETARSYELGTGLNLGGFHLAATYFSSNYDNYIYLGHTGISRSGGFLVKEWRASDTEIKGWELEASYNFKWKDKHSFELNTFADLVKNKNTADDKMRTWAEGDYMPNLPTSRYGVSTTMTLKSFYWNTTFDHYLKQRYLGKNINLEPAMPSYSLLAAQVGYSFKIREYVFTYYLSGHNLLNVEARPQNSLLKYLAPLPGRNISLGIKIQL